MLNFYPIFNETSSNSLPKSRFGSSKNWQPMEWLSKKRINNRITYNSCINIDTLTDIDSICQLIHYYDSCVDSSVIGTLSKNNLYQYPFQVPLKEDLTVSENRFHTIFYASRLKFWTHKTDIVSLPTNKFDYLCSNCQQQIPLLLLWISCHHHNWQVSKY